MELELAGASPQQARYPAVTSGDAVMVWRDEIFGYFERMHRFASKEQDEVFMDLAAFSARASEIRMRLMQIQSRAAQGFRTGEVDPFLSECDRQFRLWSRVFAVKELDVRLSGKAI